MVAWSAPPDEVRVVEERERDALVRLLLEDPGENLFTLGVLEASPLRPQRFGSIDQRFFGLYRQGRLRAMAFVAGSGQLVVPYARDARDATALARGLEGLVRVRRLVGERVACDVLTDVLVPREARRRVFTHSRLYTLEPGQLAVEARDEGLRVAGADDLRRVIPLAVAMHREDLGEDPLRNDADAYVRHVGARVAAGRVHVVERGGKLVFKVDLGTVCRHGAQVEGVYTVPEARGQGVATGALAALCDRLLGELPRVTLHVREENTAAIAVYERLGFRRAKPFRILFL